MKNWKLWSDKSGIKKEAAIYIQELQCHCYSDDFLLSLGRKVSHMWVKKITTLPFVVWDPEPNGYIPEYCNEIAPLLFRRNKGGCILLQFFAFKVATCQMSSKVAFYSHILLHSSGLIHWTEINTLMKRIESGDWVIQSVKVQNLAVWRSHLVND